MGANTPSSSGEPVGRPKREDIPESCIALVPSYLDPPEIAKLARLNRAFRAASSADFIWTPKFPSNYQYILSKLPDQGAEDEEKRNIYARLCKPNSFDGGTKEVWIDKRTGFRPLAFLQSLTFTDFFFNRSNLWPSLSRLTIPTPLNGLQLDDDRDSGADLMRERYQTGKSVTSASTTTAGKFSIKVEKRTVGFAEYFGANYLLITSGSSEQGYKLAAQLGHSIVKHVPSLFTFKIDDFQLVELSGNKYEELKSSKLAEGVVEKDIDDSALFYEASGGKNNRGRSYGCGSEAVFFESSSSRYTRFKTTHSTDPAVQDLQSRLTDVESQLAELRGLFEKMDGAFFRHGGSSSGVPRHCDDENEINPIGDDIEDDDD